MKIDINKDFEKAFPDDLWKGFTLKQIITFSVGLIMAAGTIIALWGFFKDFPGHRQLYCNPCHAADLFHRYLRIPEPFPVGDVQRDAVLQGN